MPSACQPSIYSRTRQGSLLAEILPWKHQSWISLVRACFIAARGRESGHWNAPEFKVVLACGARQIGKTAVLAEHLHASCPYAFPEDSVIRSQAVEDAMLFSQIQEPAVCVLHHIDSEACPKGPEDLELWKIVCANLCLHSMRKVSLRTDSGPAMSRPILNVICVRPST